MNNQVLRLLVLLLSFLANATIPAQQKDISKLIEERVKLVDGQMSFNTHGVTYNHGKAPQVNNRDSDFYSTLVDSSKNGYGAYYKNTNPLAYGVDEGYFAVYRQWITEEATHGIIGAAQSEDGEDWFTSQALNMVYPNGDESPDLPTATGTPQGRYPSAGYAEGAKPTAIWNEYTNASFGGGSYGGYPLHTYNAQGMSQDANWVNPLPSNAGCVNPPCDPPDLWNGNAMLIPEGNSYKFLAAYSTWAPGEEKVYMITSSNHTDGDNIMNYPYVWTDDLEITDNGDLLWYGAGYISKADYHVNADGVGYMVQVGFANLTDTNGDLITDENQGIFYKMTDDYGDSWTEDGGFKNSGYHVLPDAVALRLTDSLYTAWAEEENEYYYHYGDTLYYEGDTTENGEYIPYLMSPGWDPFYTFEMQTDANGGLHIVFPTLRKICYDYNGGCDDNDGDGYADSLYATWILGGSGIWHIYSPDPMSGEDNWTASLIFDMSADYEADWMQSDITTLYHDGDDDHLGTMQYFYPNITMSAESENVMWFAVAGMSDYEYSADSTIIPLDVDLYMAKSTDNGLHWSEAENVTNTPTTGALTNLGYPSEAALESGVHLANQGMDESVGVFYQMMDPNVNTIADNSGYEDYKNWIYVGIYGDDFMGPEDDNYSLSFAGDADYVNINAAAVFDLSDEQELAISAYIKTTENNAVVFQAELSFGYYIGTHNNGEFALTMYFDGFEDNCISNTQVTDGNWHHVTGTYNGSEMSIYVDGVLENTCGAGVLVSQDGVSPITIGAYRPGSSSYQFDGLVDELNIWDTALNQEQIQSNMSSELNGNETGLVAYWNFNEGEGDMLYDLSGNGNDGTIYGATWDEDGAPLEPNSIAALTVHEVDGALGTTVSVPVDIELLDVDISSSEIWFSGFQDQLEFLGLGMEGTLIEDAGWEVEVNEQEDVLITASAGANDISGSGTLFFLNFNIPADSDADFVPIYITDAQLNEYTEPIDLDDGGVHIQGVIYGDVSQNGDVSAYDAALVLKYLVGLDELDENQLLSAEVTLDGTVSALDASVILQYVAELIDGLPYDDFAALAGTSDIGIEDDVFTPGELLEIPIQLTNGENLLSFEMDIAYDPEIVSFEMVEWSEMIEHFSIEENNESGLLRVAGSGATPDGEECIFGNLKIFVDDEFEGESFEVAISTYRINENESVENIVATFMNSTLSLDNHAIPEVFALHQNYPNPFNPTTQIKYDLPEDAMVSITIYDIMGRSIKSLVNSNQSAGYRSIQWNATNNLGEPVSAGMYIYIIQAGQFRQVKKMVLLK